MRQIIPKQTTFKGELCYYLLAEVYSDSEDCKQVFFTWVLYDSNKLWVNNGGCYCLTDDYDQWKLVGDDYMYSYVSEIIGVELKIQN